MSFVSSSTRMNKKLPYIVVVIDGILGSGKSTLIEECLVPLLTKQGLRITVVQEPVELWKERGALKQFYADPSRRGFQFQIMAFHDRVRVAQEKFKKYKDDTDVFLLERSIFTDKLFMNMLRDSGTVDDSEHRDYFNLWQMWEEVMPFKPDLFVYLKPSVETAMKRLRERNRGGESAVSKEYQLSLEKEHDRFLGKDYVEISDSHYIPCYRLITESNFRDDPEAKKSIAKIFREQIEHIRREKV